MGLALERNGRFFKVERFVFVCIFVTFLVQPFHCRSASFRLSFHSTERIGSFHRTVPFSPYSGTFLFHRTVPFNPYSGTFFLVLRSPLPVTV